MSMARTYVCPYNVNTFYHVDGERSVALAQRQPCLAPRSRRKATGHLHRAAQQPLGGAICSRPRREGTDAASPPAGIAPGGPTLHCSRRPAGNHARRPCSECNAPRTPGDRQRAANCPPGTGAHNARNRCNRRPRGRDAGGRRAGKAGGGRRSSAWGSPPRAPPMPGGRPARRQPPPPAVGVRRQSCPRPLPASRAQTWARRVLGMATVQTAPKPRERRKPASPLPTSSPQVHTA